MRIPLIQQHATTCNALIACCKAWVSPKQNALVQESSINSMKNVRPIELCGRQLYNTMALRSTNPDQGSGRFSEQHLKLAKRLWFGGKRQQN